MIKHIQEIIRIPSVTGAEGKEGMPYGEHVYNALTYVLNLCEEFGFRVKNCENKTGYAEIGEGEEMIGILCHLDVVPEGGGWIHPPFGGEIHDGKLYGRGVIDDKGPAILAIYAMKEILDSGIELNKRIRIIFGCQEESGNWEDIQYYKATEEMPTYGFTPDADFPVIYCEKGSMQLCLSMPQEEAGFISIEGGHAPNMVADYVKCSLMTTKGTEAHLEMKGKSAHGSMPWDGENAVSKLMEKIVESNQAGLTACKFADFYMDKIGYSLEGELMNARFEDEKSGVISCSVGMIRIREEKVELILDVRFPISFTDHEVTNRIREAVKSHGVSVEQMGYSEPIYIDRDSEIIQIMMSAYRDITDDDSEPLIIGGGTYARTMENVVAFGPVFPGKECTEHQANEYMEIEDLEKAKEIYTLALTRLLKSEIGLKEK